MPILSLDEFTHYVGSDVIGVNDVLMQDAIDAAVSTVNSVCGREFVLAGPTATVREFAAGDSVLMFDDCVGVPVITVDGAVVDPGGYRLCPLNGRADDGVAVPFTSAVAGWPGVFRSSSGLVSVSARWGWSAIPVRVKEAVKLLAKDEVHLRDTKFGQHFVGDFGSVRTGRNYAALNLVDTFRRGDRAPAFGFA